MTRASFLALVVLGTAGAGAPPSLPVPPIPPRHPPTDQAAPVPNMDAHAPVPQAVQGAQLSPNLFVYRNHDTSLGYSPGSRVQTADDNKLQPAPGFTLRVPIQ